MTTVIKQSESAARLQKAVGEAILKHTRQSPMSEEEVMAVLGFCTGASIASAGRRQDIRQYRELAILNMDLGIDAFRAQSPSGLILPN